MDYEIVMLDEKIVVGVSAATGNGDPRMGEIIGGLWAEFGQGGIHGKIRGKISGYPIGLYSDYVGGDGDVGDVRYWVTVGCEVSAVSQEKAENGEFAVKVIPLVGMQSFLCEGICKRRWRMRGKRSGNCHWSELLRGILRNILPAILKLEMRRSIFSLR